eukprot:544113_1
MTQLFETGNINIQNENNENKENINVMNSNYDTVSEMKDTIEKHTKDVNIVMNVIGTMNNIKEINILVNDTELQKENNKLNGMIEGCKIRDNSIENILKEKDESELIKKEH